MFLVSPLLMVGCGGNSSTESKGPAAPQGAPVITVKERDFHLDFDKTTAAAGTVSFAVKNNGPSTHEFVVFQTDLAVDKLPTNKDGDVDEKGAGVTHIDELGEIKRGKSSTLNVNLPAGKYVMICNITGHYAAGMHTAFTVTS
jgi:uncharacterized cupredoxin-like copper-binding protein